MKTTKNLSAKKLIALFIGFTLLITTLTGILFGAKAARAETNGDVRSDTQKFAVNSPQYVVDYGIESNAYIIFNCDRAFDDIPTYINLGYDYVTVSLKFQMRELADCYQHIYLYSGVNGNELEEVKLNFHGNETKTDFEYVTINFKTRNLTEFLTNGIMNVCIKFNASGFGRNDWQYKNMEVTVKVSQTASPNNTTTVY